VLNYRKDSFSGIHSFLEASLKDESIEKIIFQFDSHRNLQERCRQQIVLPEGKE